MEPSFSIDEPSEGNVEVKVKIQRNFGRSGNVTVRKNMLNDYSSKLRLIWFKNGNLL